MCTKILLAKRVPLSHSILCSKVHSSWFIIFCLDLEHTFVCLLVDHNKFDMNCMSYFNTSFLLNIFLVKRFHTIDSFSAEDDDTVR